MQWPRIYVPISKERNGSAMRKDWTKERWKASSANTKANMYMNPSFMNAFLPSLRNFSSKDL